MADKKTGASEAKHVSGDPERQGYTFIIVDRSRVADEDEGRTRPGKLDSFVQRVAKAEQAGVQRYLDGHQKSNARRDGGWFWDFDENVFRAVQTAGRKVRLRKVVGL